MTSVEEMHMEWSQRERVDLFGIQFDAVTRDYMITRVDDAIADHHQIWLSFINVAILVQANRDPAARRVLEAADYRLCDGMGLMLASRLLRKALPEMVSGPFLLQRLLRHAGNQNYRVYLLGNKPEAIERAVLKAQEDYKALIVAGYRNGYFDASEDSAVVAQISQSDAHILFVGMGFPRERTFIQRYRQDLNVPVIVDVGGAFTVLAGIHRLAPRWMRIAGIEWIYRMAQEPRRMWKRYLTTNTIFAYLVFKALVTERLLPHLRFAKE